MKPVFLSYARRASAAHASALYSALGGNDGLAFLDNAEIENGQQFPEVLAQAVLGARVVVIFAEADYFTRWYCLRELQLALSPYLDLLGRGIAAPADVAGTLQHIVVVLPASGMGPHLMGHLPPLVRTTDWPTADQVEKVASLVRSRLQCCAEPIGRRISESRRAVVLGSLLQETAVPSPGNIGEVKVYPPVLLPSLGEGFVGRADDLWRIHFALSTMRGEAAQAAAITGALHAAGGFGKTRLAAEYVWRFGPTHYRGGLFWIDADVPEDRLVEHFHGILRMLRPETPELPEFLRTGRDARNELAAALQGQPADQPVLFIVDNVPEPAAGTSPLPLEHWCPALGRVALLATSRLRLAATANVSPLALDVLAPEPAVALLTRHLDRGGLSEEAWRYVAAWVGHLPLALELVNATLLFGGLTPQDILDRAKRGEITRELDAQRDALRGQVPSGVLRGVTEALSISYEKLTEPQQRAARLVAQLAPDAIPEYLLLAFESASDVAITTALRAALESPGTELAAQPALDSTSERPLAASESAFDAQIRTALRARAFVTPVSNGAVPAFGRMHRVLADFLRARSPDEPAEAAVACVGLLIAIGSYDAGDPNSWAVLRMLIPHGDAVFQRLRERPTIQHAPEVVQLGLVLAGVFGRQGLKDTEERYERSALDTAMRHCGPGHPQTLKAMNNLAITLEARGHHRAARELLDQVVAASVQEFGPWHAYTVRAIDSLAAMLQGQGDLSAARQLQEQTLATLRDVHGADSLDTLSLMTHLAQTLYGQGEHSSARDLLEQVIAGRKRLLGPEHLDTLSAEGELLSMADLEGDLSRLRERQEDALATRMRLLGSEHPDTLSAMNNLAGTLAHQGDNAAARTLRETVLSAARRVLGPEHPKTLTAMNNLAVVLFTLGDLSSAAMLLQDVIAVSKKLLGPDHPDTRLAMTNLARLTKRQGLSQGAERLHEQVRAASDAKDRSNESGS